MTTCACLPRADVSQTRAFRMTDASRCLCVKEGKMVVFRRSRDVGNRDGKDLSLNELSTETKLL